MFSKYIRSSLTKVKGSNQFTDPEKSEEQSRDTATERRNVGLRRDQGGGPLKAAIRIWQLTNPSNGVQYTCHRRSHCFQSPAAT